MHNDLCTLRAGYCSQEAGDYPSRDSPSTSRRFALGVYKPGRFKTWRTLSLLCRDTSLMALSPRHARSRVHHAVSIAESHRVFADKQPPRVPRTAGYAAVSLTSTLSMRACV